MTIRRMTRLFAISALSMLALSTTGLCDSAPVRIHGKTLFSLSERVGSFSPQDRAAAVSRRLRHLLDDPSFSADQITLSETGDSTDVIVGNKVIVSVTDADAKASHLSRDLLAARIVQSLRQTVQQEKRLQSPRHLLLSTLYAALVTLALGLLLLLFSRGFPLLRARIMSWHGTVIRGVWLKGVELLSADRIIGSLLTFTRVTRVAATLILLYFYFPLVFSFFPWTHGWAQQLYSYVLNPISRAGQITVEYLPKFFFIIVTIAITRYVLILVRFVFSEVGRGTIEFNGFHQEWADPTYKLVRLLVLAFALVIVFPYLPGSGSPAFQGISVFLGVLLSFGSSSAVSNMVSGVVLTYMRPFKLGDRVRIADTIGDVVEKSLLVTRVRTIKNVDVTIPNSMVLGSHIVNFSSSADQSGLILHTSVTIGYDAPWRTVHELLISAALKTPHISETPRPFVFQTSLDDFYVSYELNAYTHTPSQMATIYSELHQNIQDEFNQGGVEIMSPHYTAMRDGSPSTIPTDHLPPKPSAPRTAFRFPFGQSAQSE